MNKQFEAVIEGQKKAMEFWTNLSEQMTSAFASGSKPSTNEDLLADWYNKQQAFFREAMKVTDPQKAFEKAPEQFRQWLDMQREFSEKWVDFYRANAEKMGLKMPNLANDFVPQRYFEDGMRYWRQWMSGNEWFNDQLMSKMPFNMRPHYLNFMRVYDDLHKYWEPFTRMIQNGLTDTNVIEKYFSKDAYKQIVDQLMGFRPVGNVSELIDNVNRWFDGTIEYVQKDFGGWTSVSEGWREKFSEYFADGKVPFFQMATDFNNRLREQVVPFYNVAAQGRQTEIAKLMRDIQFSYITFILKTSELQGMVYESGQYVMPDSLKQLYDKYQESKEMPDYQAFFHQYINDLENSLLEVMHSEKYSKLQSEVAASGTQIKKMTDRMMELVFVDMPFLTKTDGDDIARETTTLRRKVRTLEQRLGELESALGTKLHATDEAAPAESEESKKKLFSQIGTASAKERDDLKKIKGIGPKLEDMLNSVGIYTYTQLSKMTEREYDLVDEMITAFQGRARRDRWSEQAKQLLGI